jgi:putative ABC transport system substrate-binding protein
MGRRAVLIAMVSVLVCTAHATLAQGPATKAARIGVLRAAPDSPVFRRNFEMFRQTLGESGLVEGSGLTIEYRVQAAPPSAIAGLAEELVRLRVDAIVAIGPPAVRAAAGATTLIPIVAVDLESDPVAEGFVIGLARPGRNVTGLFLDFPELGGKWIELLREMVPRLSRVQVAWDPSTPPTLLRGAEGAARAMRLQLSSLEARTADGLGAVFEAAASTGAGAMLVLPSPMVNSARRQIIEMAARHRMPTIMAFPEFAEEGGLIAYGPDVSSLFRQAAEVMVKVLRGTRPSVIPIERPARFEMAVNRKTAATLGLTVPRSVLVRADKVIE